MIYHILPKCTWEKVLASSSPYEPPSLHTDGFIHATSDLETLLLVANNFYSSGPEEFIVLALDDEMMVKTHNVTIKLEKAVLYEKSIDFPHIFAPLVPEYVKRTLTAIRDEKGNFIEFK